MSKYAIITFRHAGPIKTWSDMQAANVHNARTKPIAHGVPGAPEPIFLVGTDDLVQDVKQGMRAADVNPDRLRKNGVIAYEAIMTASPRFFAQGTPDERAERLEAWTVAQVRFADQRYEHRVVSMVLHLDEKTPHIHLVVLPLEWKIDGRCPERGPKWILDGKSISGPGRFDKLHDDYAAAMAGFGLARGKRKSGAKNESPAVFMDRLKREQEAAERAQADAAAMRATADREHQAALELIEQNKRAAAEVDAQRALVLADRAKLDDDRRYYDGVHRQFMVMNQEQMEDEKLLADELDAVAVQRAELAVAKMYADKERAELAPVLASAQQFVLALDDVPERARSVVEQRTVIAAMSLQSRAAAMGQAGRAM